MNLHALQKAAVEVTARGLPNTTVIFRRGKTGAQP